MTRHCTEFPEFGITLVVDSQGRADYIAWDDDGDRADESESLSDETVGA